MDGSGGGGSDGSVPFPGGVSVGWGGSCSVRSGDDGGSAFVRVCAWESFFASDRAGVLGGCCLQGDHEHAGAGSFDDCGVPPSARGEIAELFDQVLGLCREAGLVSVGVIVVDGTKIKANASMDQNRSYCGVVREILREAEQTDRREDELYGDARGDELPEQLRTAEGRKAALADARRRIEERRGRAVGPQEPEQDVEVDPELVLGRGGRRGGRREWPRVARRELESRRERRAEAIGRDREGPSVGALGRLGEPSGRSGCQRRLRALAVGLARHAGTGPEGQQQAICAARSAGRDDQPV